jgi:hypothetical protein
VSHFFNFHRAPETASMKSKMIYASSKEAIKKKFSGNYGKLFQILYNVVTVIEFILLMYRSFFK